MKDRESREKGQKPKDHKKATKQQKKQQEKRFKKSEYERVADAKEFVPAFHQQITHNLQVA
jgi:hypothetical protein